jgi:hypothetical protein
MNLNGINIRDLTFPGRAGELQAEAATAAFIREVGDNYASYNRFLAEEARRLGGSPHPDDYRPDRYEEYLRDATRARDIVAAEMVLRRARALRVEGKSLREPLDRSTPVFDAAHRLISAETGQPTLDYPGSRRALEAPVPRVPDVAPR